MADVFLPAINGTDANSDPDAWGGFLGSGDLASNDGDATGWEGWDTTPVWGLPMPRLFEYEIDVTNLPDLDTVTGYQFEMTLRIVPGVTYPPEASDWAPPSVTYPDGEPYPYVGASPTWTGVGQFFDHVWAGVAYPDAVEYATYASDVKSIPTEMRTQLETATAGLTLQPHPLNTNASTYPRPVRCTMAGIRVFYEGVSEPTEPPILRVYPRSDGRGLSSARRVWPPSKASQDKRWLPYGGGYR